MGVAPVADPPLEWSDEKNLRWKVRLPGTGHSTPVVWDDRIFVTTAIPYGDELDPIYDNAPGTHDNVPVRHHHEFAVIAIHRSRGDILWQRTVRRALPHEGGHYTGSLASNSPVTDGKFVYAHFGSRGLYCLTVDGDAAWDLDLGAMKTIHAHGEGSSPALHGNTLVVNWDHEGQSFVVALDASSGKQRWKLPREEITSWASPIVAEHRGKPQVIISGTNKVRGYDLATGQVLWECGGLSQNIVASPVAGDGLVFAGSSYEKRALLAIQLDGAAGDITDTRNVLWTRTRGTPYVPSPLLYQGGLFFLAHYQGVLTRVDAKTGDDQPGAFRLPGIRDVYASPVAAAGRIYVTDREGTTIVIDGGAVPRVLALNKLDDAFSASAAVAGRELFLRGERHLYCIAE